MLTRGQRWPFLVLALVLGVLLHAVLTGDGLVPADGILSAPPWVTYFHGQPSNYLLFDQFAVFVPVRQFFTDELWNGRFPLWNPHLAAGVPSLAAMQVAALYPIHLLVSPIGPFYGSGIAAFLKLFLAGAFTLMYARRLGASPAAALASGIVYALSGFLIVWLGHPQVNCAVLLPLLLYFLERQFDAPLRLGPPIGFACAYACMLLGGHPPTAFHISAVVALYFLFRLTDRGRPFRLRLTLAWLVAIVAGAVIAAPQLLPYLEYYRESSSAAASAALHRWDRHLTPATLAHLLLPYLSGAPNVGFEWLAKDLGLGDIANFNERTGYVGVFTLFLAVVGIVRARTRIVLFHAALLAGSLLVVYGAPPIPALVHALPVANAINHQRLLLIVDFGAAVLAGFGLDAILRATPDRRPRRLAIGFAVAVGLALVVLWAVIGAGYERLDASSRRFLLAQLWIAGAGVLAAVVVTLRQLPAKAIAIVAVASVAVDLLWFATGYNPAIPSLLYYPATDGIRLLQREASRVRVLGESTVLTPNSAAVYGLDDARGMDFMAIKRYEELITGTAGDFLFYRSATQFPPSFPLLNVKYVLLPAPLPVDPEGFELVYTGEMTIYRNTRVSDRALIVFDHEVERDAATVLARVRSGSFDPAKTVLLEEAPAPVPQAADPSIVSAEARIATYEPDRLVIDARLPRPGFLLLLDNFYPGWRAFAAGGEVPIQRADYTFRAVALPAGETRVEFVYRPMSFRLGVMASVVAIVGLAIAAVRDRRRDARVTPR
jgi:hypothetical protein